MYLLENQVKEQTFFIEVMKSRGRRTSLKKKPLKERENEEKEKQELLLQSKNN